MGRKIISMMLFITISLSLQAGALATNKQPEEISVFLNDIRVVLEGYGTPYIDEKNHILIPLRAVLEKFGAKVTWNQAEYSVILQKGLITVKVPIGKDFIYKNGEMIKQNTITVIKNGRTYLEAYTIMEAFGCEVKWSDNDKAIYVNYYYPNTIISKLPQSYDLRDYNKVTAVKNQLDIGTCWAFSAIGAIESFLQPITYDFSEDHLSLNHGYNVSQNDGGDFNIAMSYFARWDGPVLEQDDSYGDGKTSPGAKVQKHVQEAYVLPVKDYQAIKFEVLLHGGVQTSMYFDPVLIKNSNLIYNNDTSAFYYTGTAKINHSVIIVGWDDNFSKENFALKPAGDGAFICKNSYGEDFGDEGYFYVSYYDKHIGTENTVYSRIDETNNYKNIYQTDLLGWVGRLGYNSNTAYFANAYSLQHAKEKLRAVSFYSTGENTSYEIYLVKDFNDMSSFKNMSFLKKGILNYTGYYTIDFDVPILLESEFAVVVKITTPNSNLPVAAEYYKEVEWLTDVNISDGEGYISANGSSWDSTEAKFESNVCLKAFTDNVY